MGSALRQRKHGSIIKLSVNSDINKEIFEIITNELDVSLDDMVRHQSMIGLSDTSELYNLDRPVIVAYLMIIVTFFVFLNLAVDILYTFLDQRSLFLEEISFLRKLQNDHKDGRYSLFFL